LYKRAIILSSLILTLVGCSGKTSDELYAEGVRELRKGNGNGAIVLLKNALEKDQNNTAARYQLAKAYVAVRKYEQAEKEFQKVQRLNPSQQDIQLDLAKLYNLLKKPDMAISHAEEHLKTYPGSADALEALGIAYARQNKPEEAEANFLRALEKEAGRTGTKLELAELYARHNNKQKAVELLNEVIKEEPNGTRAPYLLADIELSQGSKNEALALFNKITASHTDDPQAPYKAALIHMDRGDIAAAGKIAEDLIARFPRRSEGFRLKGLVSFRRNNYPEAIASLQNSVKIQPNVVGYYYLGLSLYNQGELENALSQFRQLLDQVPSLTQARVLVGMILLRQRRLDDAIAEINKVVQSDERNALAHNILGSAYLAKGLYDEGMKELNLATQLDPRSIDAHLKKGLVHLNQGKTNEVEADLKAAVRVAPELLNTRIMLSSFYLQRNNHAKALSVLNEGLTGKKSDSALYADMARVMFADKKPDQGLDYLQKAKESDPSSLAPYFISASYHTDMGKAGDALQQYAEILQRDAGNISALLKMAALLDLNGRHADAEGYCQKAKATGNPLAYQAVAERFAQQHEYKKALTVLDEGLKRSPRSPALLETKGRLQLQEKQYKEALKTLDELVTFAPERGIALKIKAHLAMNNPSESLALARRAINLHPDSAWGYLLLASIYQQQKDPERAIQELKNGLRIDAGNSQAALMLAESYAKNGNHALAMQTCEDLLRKQPGFTAAHIAMGTYLEAAGKKKEAARKYLHVLAISGNNPLVLNNLAYLYADGYGTKEESVKLAERALALDPHNAGIMDTLGYALMKNGHLNDARKTLEQAVSLRPGNPTINYHLALTYQALGEKGPAAEQLRKALQSGEFAEARQARSLLSQLN